VLGLSVFYQYVRTAALNQHVTKVAPYTSAFTTELFAHYVHIKYLLAEKENCRMLRHTPLPASEIQRCLKRFYECTDMFITDVLLFCVVSCTQCMAYDRGHFSTCRDHTKPVISCQLDTSDLVELLQQSAVEHLTEFRQLEAREFGTVDGIVSVTIDFEALYAYKCGEYQRCLQLSTNNLHVCALLDDATEIPVTLSFPEFIQLMDDNIASLIALTLIVNMSSRKYAKHSMLHQRTLSLYLMSQCQMKLHHSATSLAQTLNTVETILLNPRNYTLDQLLLKFTEKKILSFLVILRKCLSIFNVCK